MALRYMTAGESHGPALCAILEGLPAGLPLSEADFASDLARRQSGAGSGARMRIEQDAARILGGVMAGKTTGAPLALEIPNADAANWRGKAVGAYTVPRPGHADLAAVVKYGFDDIRYALERASARETAARVAVGAACRALLAQFGVTVGAYVRSIGEVAGDFSALPSYAERFHLAGAHACACPDAEAAARMAAAIQAAKTAGETLGGVIEVVALGLPAGLGSYVSADRRLDGRLAQALLAIPAVKGLEIGDAFANAAEAGSQAHDAILFANRRVTRPTNRCGGLEGGMTNGQPLVLRAAMKPIPTTLAPQQSFDLATGEPAETRYERSDVCPVPRACVVLEAAAAFVLADAFMEKLGGDSLTEILPRFAALPVMETAALSDQPKVFWPDV